jgi:hypothetical protein
MIRHRSLGRLGGFQAKPDTVDGECETLFASLETFCHIMRIANAGEP